MSAEIVTPFGIHAAQEPCEEVIARIRDMLAKAERGEILGIVYGWVKPNHVVSFGVTAGTADANLLVAAASQAWFDVMHALNDVASDD